MLRAWVVSPVKVKFEWNESGVRLRSVAVRAAIDVIGRAKQSSSRSLSRRV